MKPRMTFKEKLDGWCPDLEVCSLEDIVDSLKNPEVYNLNDYTASGDTSYVAPWFSWEITRYCQYRCTYCYAWEILESKFDKSAMSIYPIVLKRLRFNNCPEFHMELLGGEPTTHPGLFDILDDLEDNKKCLTVELITNLARPLSFFEKLNERNYKKLIIASSYHNEYDNDNGEDFIKKSIEINKFENINFYFANINVALEETAWQKSVDIVSGLSEYSIPNHFNLIHSTQKYSGFDFGYDYNTGEHITDRENISQLTSNFLQYCIDRRVLKSDMFNNTYQRVVKYKHKTTGEIVKIPELVVRLNKLDRFKGWNCDAKMYTIEHDGNIHNDCTREPIDFMLKGLGNCVQCPISSGCQCDVMLSFSKNK